MRNFIYNKSDIIVAVLIIIVALVIIFFRVNAIMDFGDAATVTSNSPAEGSTSADPAEGEDEGEVPEDLNPDDQAGVEDQAASGESVSFVVPSGASSDSIASDLASQGLISSADEFLNEVKAQQLETKLMSGTFSIPAGSSVADIVKILT